MADVKKFMFWIVSGLITVIVTILWFIAVGKLDEERTQQANQINSRFSEMNGIKDVNDGNHPNKDFTEGMDTIMGVV
ncbi:MAG: hypothetical protein VX776_08635, partial [Planctomycetota bacterium]|nr:hypothetical protein [Planctomycetota bacterium]